MAKSFLSLNNDDPLDLKDDPMVWQAILVLTNRKGWEHNSRLVEVVQELNEMYQGKDGLERRVRQYMKFGFSIAEIAEKENLELKKVSNVVHREKAKAKARKERDSRAKEVIAMYQEEHSMVHVAKAFSIAPKTVADILRENNVPVVNSNKSGRRKKTS